MGQVTKRHAAGLAFAATIVSAAAPAAAQYAEKAVGKAGPFVIHQIAEGGKFNRCAATLMGKPGMLRLSWNVNHAYSISVPPPKVMSSPLILSIGTPSGVLSNDAVTNGQRAWSGLDQLTVDALMKVKGSIVVDLGRNHFVWPIGRTDMTDVFVKMEDCVLKAQGR